MSYIDYDSIAQSLGFENEEVMYIKLIENKYYGKKIRELTGISDIYNRAKLYGIGFPRYSNKGKIIEGSIRDKIKKFGVEKLKDMTAIEICSKLGIENVGTFRSVINEYLGKHLYKKIRQKGSLKKIFEEDMKEFGYNKIANMTNREIQRQFKLTERQIAYLRDKYGLVYKKRKRGRNV